MSNQSPKFLLKVADALVNEVSQNTDTVLETARRLENREGFMDRLRGTFAAGALVGELKNNLVLAMKLSDTAAQADLNIRLDDGTTPAVVKAKALFQRGLIAMGQKYPKEAVKCFEDSINYAVDQTTYFNIALCFLQMKGVFRDRAQDAVASFQKCIELNPEGEIAIEAGKELARLGQL